MEFVESELIGGDVNDEYPADSAKNLVECICPKCRVRHALQMHWIGDFTPWKYCKRCRGTIE